MNPEKEYLYAMPVAKALAITVFFALCGVVLYHEYTTNDRGLIINGIITLDKGGADIFYLVLAICSALFVVAGIASLFIGRVKKEYLRLYSDRIEIPWKKEAAAVQFNMIEGIKRTDISGTIIVEITTKDGKKYSITNARVKGKKEFGEIMGFLSAKTNIAI